MVIAFLPRQGRKGPDGDDLFDLSCLCYWRSPLMFHLNPFLSAGIAKNLTFRACIKEINAFNQMLLIIFSLYWI